jgi:hypothetical protein
VLRAYTHVAQFNCILLSNGHNESYARHTKSVWGRCTHRWRRQSNVTSGWNFQYVPKDIKSAEVRTRYKPRPRGIGTWGGSTRIRCYFRLGLRRFNTVPNQYENCTMQPFLFLLMLMRVFLSVITSLEPNVTPHGRSGHRGRLVHPDSNLRR